MSLPRIKMAEADDDSVLLNNSFKFQQESSLEDYLSCSNTIEERFLWFFIVHLLLNT